MNRHLALILLLATLACAASLAAGAGVFKPPSPLTFNAFVGGNESWFTFPEASTGSNYSMPSVTSRPSFGITLSGGGMRAATSGLGWLRALHAMGATDAARYLTSNSGGSWLNTAFSFQHKVPIPSFLGPHIPPQQLTLEALKQVSPPESFEAALANARLLLPGVEAAVRDTLGSLRSGQQQQGVGAWSANVGRSFLEPFDLNADAATFTANGTSGPVHQALQTLDTSQVAIYTYVPGASSGSNGSSSDANSSSSTYRPFPVMMGSILLQDTPLGFYAFEFTPLYVGIAPFFNDTQPPIGGGYVDPVGLNSPAPEPAPQLPASVRAAFAATNVTGFNNGTLLTNTSAPGTTAAGSSAAPAGPASATGSSSGQLPASELLSLTSKPDYLVPLKVVTGISSSFITNMIQPGGELSRQLTGTEVLRYWSPLNFTSKQLPFADGGSADNLAVTPLLRRRVRKMVVLVSASHNISDTNSTDWAGHQWDVSSLFGAAPLTHPSYDKRGNNDSTITGIPSDLFNRKMHVFPTAGYEQLYQGLHQTTAAGGPTHHLANYTVLTNPYQSIFGGWQVEVLWVVMQQQAAWEKALPPETAQVLEQGRAPDRAQGGGLLGSVRGFFRDRPEAANEADPASLGLQDFPFISTGKANYSPELVRLLSQCASWQMLALRPQLQQLLAGTDVSLRPVAA